MRAGLPVVASDVGGCREAVVDGQTGFLFEPGDVEMLGQRLSQLTADQGLRRQMGLAGQERFITRFTADKMVEDTVKIYKDVLTGAEN
jgi:glycosyltransferase involved in cell wall biosynthesis